MCGQSPEPVFVSGELAVNYPTVRWGKVSILPRFFSEYRAQRQNDSHTLRPQWLYMVTAGCPWWESVQYTGRQVVQVSWFGLLECQLQATFKVQICDSAWKLKAILMFKTWFILLMVQHGVTWRNADIESSSHLNSDATIHRHMHLTLTPMEKMVALGDAGCWHVITCYSVWCH